MYHMKNSKKDFPQSSIATFYHNKGKGKMLPVTPGSPGLPWDPCGGLTQPAPANKEG